jgi:hypothetical protein
MLEQFNRLLQGFGANRVRITEVDEGYIQFSIIGWGDFCIWRNGELLEWDGLDYQANTRSVWLQDVSKGKKRNDAGVLA